MTRRGHHNGPPFDCEYCLSRDLSEFGAYTFRVRTNEELAYLG
jgi:hypothetical protein